MDYREWEGGSSLIICKWRKIDSLPRAHRGYATALSIIILKGRSNCGFPGTILCPSPPLSMSMNLEKQRCYRRKECAGNTRKSIPMIPKTASI